MGHPTSEMDQKFRYMEEWCELSIKGVEERPHCSAAIKAQIERHSFTRTAFKEIVEHGFGSDDLLDHLDEITHPYSPLQKKREEQWLKKLRRDRDELLRAVEILDKISSQPTLRPQFGQWTEPSVVATDVKDYADVLDDFFDVQANYVRLLRRPTFRTALLAIDFRVATRRPPPWRQIAVIVEAAYEAHGTQKHITEYKVREAERTLEREQPLLYRAHWWMASRKRHVNPEELLHEFFEKWVFAPEPKIAPD